jgi:OOP family OmpA-OmpF porin
MKKLIVLLLSSVALSVSAQGYITSSDGRVVKSGTDLCWRTGTFSPSEATKECDPQLLLREKVQQTLNSDVLFDFDKVTLTAAGKSALDEVSKNIILSSEVRVVGHTDRIGTEHYNLRLSEARATVVADYLDSKVIANYRVIGVGLEQPSGKTSQCKGSTVTDSLIKCLAPDRRVVITYNK